MSQVRLTDEEIQKLIECIQSGAELPEDLLPKLSPGFFEKLRASGKFDYKELDRYKIPVLEYAGKRSEGVILAQAAITGGAAPLQVIRSFGERNDKDWQNMIVQGDNLQFLKTCYMNQDPLVKNKIKGKVKLIYIDPPFATESDFQNKDGVQSYSDKIDRSEFIEALRERIIYLTELLASDGSIFIHLDMKMNHYIKIILDDILGGENFRNEIIWKRSTAHSDVKQGSQHFGRIHDVILFYTKSDRYVWNSQYTDHSKDYIDKFYKNKEEVTGRRYMLDNLAAPGGASKGNPYYEVMGIKRYWQFSKEKMGELIKKGRIVQTKPGNVPRYKRYLDEMKGVPLQSIWDDIRQIQSQSNERVGYPTQKPESLLERIIMNSSNANDLIMDVFAGSGTVASIAEKTGRRWVVCDFGKHALYTIQKRILNVAASNKVNGNVDKKEKYGVEPRPFNVISAGAYDFSKIMNLRKNQGEYISFVLGLFGIMRETTDFSRKYKLPNLFAEKEGNPVEVYPIWDDEYLKEISIDEEYLQGIIDASGGKLKGNYYIITPETCTVIGSTTLKNSQKEDVLFHMLKFPYKVLEDVSRQFQIEEQPSSNVDINKLISSTGFYFNEEVSIKVKKEKNGIKIEDFATRILNSNKELFNDLDGLSMILIDINYDGNVFNMDQAIYARDIAEDNLVKVSGISDNTALIAIDKHGNESKILRI